MKGKKLPFWGGYLLYLLILIAVVSACILYVRNLLGRYEDNLPERRAEAAAQELAADAMEEDLFWEKYKLPELIPGRFEESLALKGAYLAQYMGDNPVVVQKGAAGEDELCYTVENNGKVIARVKLRASGPAVTRLAILNFREWEIEDVSPILEKREYSVVVPADFDISVNGIALSGEEGIADGKEITYTIEGVYLEPVFDIRDENGNKVEYAIEDGRVLTEYYYYTLVLPSALTVRLNGTVCEGEELAENRVRYDIRELVPPVVEISDDYGNVVNYEGGEELPLTHVTIKADSRYTVNVAGGTVPEGAVSNIPNPEYALLADYVEDLPQLSLYEIAVLEENAKITVWDEAGNTVPVDPGQDKIDLTAQEKGPGDVPDSVADRIDVLAVAQAWSLFMSRDTPFSEVSGYLMPDSKQYDVAKKYATGIDITFTSRHTLGNPAFTENEVTNFVWITEDCFSVDISFVKHLFVGGGRKVDDPMNDRFYFVRYEGKQGRTGGSAWRIVGMKEILDNGEE